MLRDSSDLVVLSVPTGAACSTHVSAYLTMADRARYAVTLLRPQGRNEFAFWALEFVCTLRVLSLS